ncbi:protein disulfide-isomerase MPD1 precursor [Dendryphion nanum]|uniref:protein disulfide-isomerase n=1 Tax=Dendryphion nanum TaxID=256645 RepID=A0A9P9DPT9_9PLEO|nr:protein disulfide-isomerase MPD1 precursor [Dendryphion nanum]
MVHSTACLLAAAASLFLGADASLYTKNSAVLQVNGGNYDRLIAKSNYTSVVEFYAPWCGHCKNLKPAYESAAKSLAGIAKVAAVNCDDEANKPLCGQMGVQGFPTLKIVRPSKKVGKPTVEDYQGARTAKAIVDAVKDKVPNIVKRVTDKNLDEWLQDVPEAPKAILFSEKGAISATLRALAIDFAGLIPVAQIRSKEQEAVKKYGVTKYPTLILLPAGDKEPIVYDGEVNKEGLVKFLSKVATPNPDCPPANAKKSKAKDEKKDNKKASKSSSKFAKASASHKSSDASSAATSAKSETVEEPVKPSASPDANLKDENTAEPIAIHIEKPTIPLIAQSPELHHACLNDKSLTCILAILPFDEFAEAPSAVVASLAGIHKKHGDKLFPFYSVPVSNPLATSLVEELKLGSVDQVHLLATHGKRAWYKKYPGTTFGSVEVEAWVDAIRMGEGKKEKLPEGIVIDAAIAEAEVLANKEKVADQEPIKIEVEEIVEEKGHDEL